MEDISQNKSITNYVLIDYENVQPEALSRLDAEHFKVIVFVGASQTKVTREVAIALQRMGDKAEYIEISGNGKNALDFHIAYYIGRLTTNDPSALFHIISKDKGFEPLIKHLETDQVFVKRSDDVSSLLKAVTVPLPAKQKVVAVKSPAKRKVAVTTPTITKKAVPAKKKATITAPPTQPDLKTADTTTLDKKIAVIIGNLQRRGESKPRTLKTLKSTLNSPFKNRLEENELDTLLNLLQKMGIVTVDGTKVSYNLP